METEKTFVNGLISKDVADTAPEWILGKMSMQVNELINWLEKNRKLQDENGWINLTVKRSQKTGKRYIEVDTWKPKAEPVDEKKDTFTLPEVTVDTGEVPASQLPKDLK
jgi:hypothetical protein